MIFLIQTINAQHYLTARINKMQKVEILTRDDIKCPQCDGIDFKRERRLDGYIECINCGFKGKRNEFLPTLVYIREEDKIKYYSHDNAREFISVAITLPEVKNALNHYVKQNEENEIFHIKQIKNYNLLLKYYHQLVQLKEEQIEVGPTKESIAIDELEIVVYNKIKRLRRKMEIGKKNNDNKSE